MINLAHVTVGRNFSGDEWRSRGRAQLQKYHIGQGIPAGLALDEPVHRLVIAFRQRTLALKHTYGRRILNISDLRTATEVLDHAARELLNDLADLPQKLLDPHWLESFEAHEPEAREKETDRKRRQKNG